LKSVTIVGVGLIGGSFALGLRKSGFAGRILGVSSEGTLAVALRRGAIDEGLPLEQAVPQSDLIFLAQPIAKILDVLPQVAKLAAPSALVTDAGSTKTVIVSRASKFFGAGAAAFLGGHPMTGKAVRGIEAAEADLFRGAAYVLTPQDCVLLECESVREFCAWLDRLGARRIVMTPEAHDELVAFTSHLPQMASTALASILLEQMKSADSWKVAGGGLRDTTRLAGSAYELWRDICMTNHNNIERALSAYILKLEHLRDNLRSRALAEEFQRGAEFLSEFQKKNENPA
jgi:prephenate dehydrogenase